MALMRRCAMLALAVAAFLAAGLGATREASAFTLIPQLFWESSPAVGDTGTGMVVGDNVAGACFELVTIAPDCMDDPDDPNDDDDCEKIARIGQMGPGYGGEGLIPSDPFLSILRLSALTEIPGIAGISSINQPFGPGMSLLDIRLPISDTVPINWSVATVQFTATHSLFGMTGDSRAVLTASTLDGDIVDIQSDFFDFSQTLLREIELVFEGITPGLALGDGNFLRDFNGRLVSVKIFVDRFPSSLDPQVPEPTGVVIWSILGAGGLAAAWRKRNRRASPG
jgi:hypothetical protein